MGKGERDDIVIIGGGPNGMTAAAYLAKCGLSLCVPFRPNQECSSTKTPIEGLYVCGVSTYPGGVVLGGSGYLGANKVVEDLGAKKWWKPMAEMERYIKTYLE